MCVCVYMLLVLSVSYGYSILGCNIVACVLLWCVKLTVEDLERNDGTAERPYFMSERLLETLQKKNEDVK